MQKITSVSLGTEIIALLECIKKKYCFTTSQAIRFAIVKTHEILTND